MKTIVKNERFSAEFQDHEEDRWGGWRVVEWTHVTLDADGNVLSRMGSKVAECYNEESAVNQAAALNLRYLLSKEQDVV